jgi:hypothetical protein
MSCHKTDPNNPVPEGVAPVPHDTVIHECTGALILQQRELMLFQEHAEAARVESAKDGFKRYKAAGGTMTLYGLRSLVNRVMFGALGGMPMSRPDLSQPVDLGFK